MQCIFNFVKMLFFIPLILTYAMSSTSYDISYLYLPTFWHAIQSNSTVSILADISQLSIPEVKLALPYLANVLVYQLVAINQHQPNQINALLSSFQENFAPFSIHLRPCWWESLDFATVKVLAPLASGTKNLIFSNSIHYHQLLGYLITQTQLPLAKLENLLQWQSVIAIASLMEITTDIPLNTTQLSQWLTLQPNLGIQTKDIPMTIILDIKLSSSLQELLSSRYAVTPQLPFFNAILSTIHTKYLYDKPSHLSAYTTYRKPTPTRLIKYPTNTPAQSGMTSIFDTPTVKISFIQWLQKYWIATSVVLSGLVVGSMALFSSNFSKSNTRDAVPTTEPPIHDVAILKVASSPAETLPTKIRITSTKVDKSKEIAKTNKAVSITKASTQMPSQKDITTQSTKDEKSKPTEKSNSLPNKSVPKKPANSPLSPNIKPSTKLSNKSEKQPH